MGGGVRGRAAAGDGVRADPATRSSVRRPTTATDCPGHARRPSGRRPWPAAQRLHIHTNTLRYRPTKIEQTVGINLADPDIRLVLALQRKALDPACPTRPVRPRPRPRRTLPARGETPLTSTRHFRTCVGYGSVTARSSPGGRRVSSS
ncbi:helix-turn-helix domain-containing protein [Streptomyces mirabilis]|uniref:helix-turn-helix domain-containing protein n=1 Tax=Streptomyces mirabilis TaxID=68239 RepID=UPI0033A7C8A4